MTSHNRTEPVTRCSTVSRLAASSVSRRGGDCSIMVISYSLSYNRRSINERFRFPFSLRLRNMIVWRHSLSSCIGWNWKWSSESSISSLYCLHSLAPQYLTNDLQRVSDLMHGGVYAQRRVYLRPRCSDDASVHRRRPCLSCRCHTDVEQSTGLYHVVTVAAHVQRLKSVLVAHIGAITE